MTISCAHVACIALIFVAGAGTPAKARSFRGLVRALNEVALSIEFEAKVSRLGFREGEEFRKGDVLIAFDCRRHLAELKALEATAREMSFTLQSNERLFKHKAAGSNDVEISRARADKADAEAEAFRIRLDQCAIKAPFDGSVVSLALHEHEYAAPQKPFMSILDVGASEIEVIVPSSVVHKLPPGALFNFSIDETGETLPATIDRRSGTVDAVSQTTKIYAKWQNAPAGVLPGMSGTAEFDAIGQTADGAR